MFRARIIRIAGDKSKKKWNWQSWWIKFFRTRHWTTTKKKEKQIVNGKKIRKKHNKPQDSFLLSVLFSIFIHRPGYCIPYNKLTTAITHKMWNESENSTFLWFIIRFIDLWGVKGDKANEIQLQISKSFSI